MNNEIKILVGIISIFLLGGRLLLMKGGVERNKQYEKNEQLNKQMRKYDSNRRNEPTNNVYGDDESKKKYEEIKASRAIKKEASTKKSERTNSFKFMLIQNELQEKLGPAIYDFQFIHVSKETKVVSVLKVVRIGNGDNVESSGRMGSIDFDKNGDYYFIPFKWNVDNPQKKFVEEKIVKKIRYKNSRNKIKESDLIICVDKGPSAGRDNYSFKERKQ